MLCLATSSTFESCRSFCPPKEKDDTAYSRDDTAYSRDVCLCVMIVYDTAYSRDVCLCLCIPPKEKDDTAYSRDRGLCRCLCVLRIIK